MSHIRFVLLDRDGTLIVDKHYLSDPAGVEILPGAAEGLGMLAWAGTKLFVVTNQSGIGRGYCTQSDYYACDGAMKRQFAEKGIRFTGTAFCPHTPEDACACRKPALGMWYALRDQYSLRAEHTAMIGDKVEDIAFGLAAGFSATVLVLTGKGEASAQALGLPQLTVNQVFLPLPERREGWPHALARDLKSAALWLLDQNQPGEMFPQDPDSELGRDMIDLLRSLRGDTSR